MGAGGFGSLSFVKEAFDLVSQMQFAALEIGNRPIIARLIEQIEQCLVDFIFEPHKIGDVCWYCHGRVRLRPKRRARLAAIS